MNSRPLPKFANETEEADWWYAQRDRLTEEAAAALARGELKERRLPPSPLTGRSAKSVTIRVPEQDLARAQDLAAKRGVGCQTYLKMLLHEALEAEEKRLAS
jgi:hypothetical protein